MAELTVTAGTGRRRRSLAWLGFALTLFAGILLALVPLGWRLGLWSFDTSFIYLMAPVPFVALAGFVLSLLALFGWRRGSGASRLATVLGLGLGAALIYYPLHFYALAFPLPILHTTPLPPIHDITTDAADPPQFAATLAARAVEHGASPVYGGPALARQQQAGYPDIAPLATTLPPAQAFRVALAVAQTMPRWTIVSSNPETGIIEGSARTFFMGFTDDFVIRVHPEGSGSRIDMRSESRQGVSDLGANAERIRRYLAALKAKLS